MSKDITMEVHDLPYIAYAIALHLHAYDPTFDTDSIDDMWEEKVMPMAREFYNSPEYNDNIYNESFMESLNRYCNEVLEYQQKPKKVYEVHVGIRVTKDLYVEAVDEEDAKRIASYHLEDLKLDDMEFASDDYDVIRECPEEHLSGTCLSSVCWYKED